MDFIPGLELSESFYFDIIKPLLQKNYPKLRFAAALLGRGSEVQGFDDITSTDHHWGVRLLLFLENKDFEYQKAALNLFFRKNLPFEFKGHSINWTPPNLNDNNNQFPEHKSEGDINHRVEIFTVSRYLFDTLGIDSTDLSDIDWLLLPEQRLREITAGKVFEDSVGALTNARKTLSYFPHNVWLYKILTQWNKIAEEMPFPGRIGMQNDTFGAQIETSRLIRYAMVLCFILEKKYIPYPKWFGRAFSELKLSRKLTPIFQMALNEFNFKKRDEFLCEAYLNILQYQNSLGITESLNLNPKLFFSRPITIIDVSKIMNSIRILIKPPLNTVKHPLGSIDQIVDYPNLICDSHYFKKLRILFGEK